MKRFSPCYVCLAMGLLVAPVARGQDRADLDLSRVLAPIPVGDRSSARKEPTRLFASGDLTGWVEEQHHFFKKKHPGATTWSVKDGVVHCDGTLGNCGFLRYDRKLTDFTLRLEYRMSRKCNSGVCFRFPVPYNGMPEETIPSRTGFEVQIQDDAGQPASKTCTGAFYGLLAPRVNAARPAGEWNTLEISCRGPKIRVVLNGETIQDVDQSKGEGLRERPLSGYLALQNHGHDIEFRNVRLD